MYTRLYLNRTKKKYRETLEMALAETLFLTQRTPSMTMYKVIYDQLVDIKENIILKNVVFTEDEIFGRYNLGAIAVKNFEVEEDEYAQKLSDVFGGSIDYYQMPEE
ncbi:MAG: immunity protein Tsi6 family protein [Flavobacterium sp.]|nr:immunity protein Tsi6 family protein [Flavobacterium sp.]